MLLLIMRERKEEGREKRESALEVRQRHDATLHRRAGPPLRAERAIKRRQKFARDYYTTSEISVISVLVAGSGKQEDTRLTFAGAAALGVKGSPGRSPL